METIKQITAEEVKKGIVLSTVTAEQGGIRHAEWMNVSEEEIMIKPSEENGKLYVWTGAHGDELKEVSAEAFAEWFNKFSDVFYQIFNLSIPRSMKATAIAAIINNR